jgi:hypothetical protein
MPNYVACRAEVYNRGPAPEDFLDELVAWANTASDDIFAVNDREDIYSSIVGQLGPWEGPKHRKAAMLEVLRVLGGYESSWDWMAGIDPEGVNSNTPCTEEAGIFQCSGNSMEHDPSLRALLMSVAGKTDCKTFRETTKSNHVFAVEYCARLLRFTITHHGPIKSRKKNKHIHPWLRKDAVQEFMSLLA